LQQQALLHAAAPAAVVAAVNAPVVVASPPPDTLRSEPVPETAGLRQAEEIKNSFRPKIITNLSCQNLHSVLKKTVLLSPDFALELRNYLLSNLIGQLPVGLCWLQ
jgi:hypothetical protein